MKKRETGDKTRRDFFKSTAATTAGVLLGSQAFINGKANARNQDEPVEQEQPKDYPADRKEKVRIGVIGTGGMGGAHLRAFLNMRNGMVDNVDIVALCDVAKPRMDANLGSCSNEQGFQVRGYSDYRKLLESNDIDCVLIATPEHWHGQMIIDSMDAGKDVYCEKPMTLRLRDALRVYKYAKGRKEKLLVGTQYMTYPKYTEAKELIADGAIGHPTFSQTSYCRNSKNGEWLYGIDDRIIPGETLDWDAWCGPMGKQKWDPEVYHRWRRYRRWSTGIIGDLLVHKMTPLMLSIDPGWPIRVTASGGHYVDKTMENHDQVNIQVEFENDHTMIVAGSTCNEYGLEEIIRGHKGNLFTGGGQVVLRPERVFADEIFEEKFQYDGIDPHNTIRHDFFNCVRTRKDPISPVEHATKVMVIVDLATRSMWSGHAYSFDPKTWTARSI